MTVPLNQLFAVTYGNKFDLNKMISSAKSEGGVNFVGRSSQNHGVSGVVAPLRQVAPFPAGSITVALGGTKLLTSFVQLEPFYTAQNVAVLQALVPLTMPQKLFICLCIRHNKFRYTAFGREANRTLRTLPVPHPNEFPAWLSEVRLDALDEDYSPPALNEPPPPLCLDRWSSYSLAELFDIKKGVRLTQAKIKPGNTPFISAIDKNNGLRQRISMMPNHPAGLITVNYNGSVAEAFYQPEPFFASDDVNVLYPRFEMDVYLAIFFCTLIRREKYRYNYGRKWNLERMKEAEIFIPTLRDETPDWVTMKKIIQTLPYAGAVSRDLEEAIM